MDDVSPSVLGGPGLQGAEYTLDLSWLPANADGAAAYTLTLLQQGWDDIAATARDGDRAAICAVLDAWLEQVVRSRDRSQLERWIATDTA